MLSKIKTYGVPIALILFGLAAFFYGAHVERLEADEEIAQMVIFYPTPDFTKEEQCTEEWLISHQYNAEPMTKEEWTDFYIEFSSLYAMNQYKKANENVN